MKPEKYIKTLKKLLKEFDKLALGHLSTQKFICVFLILIAISLSFNFVLNIPLDIFGMGYILLGVLMLIRNIYLIRKKQKGDL